MFLLNKLEKLADRLGAEESKELDGIFAGLGFDPRIDIAYNPAFLRNPEPDDDPDTEPEPDDDDEDAEGSYSN